VEIITYHEPKEMRSFLCSGLPEKFTTADLAEQLETPRWLAQKMAYCLRKMGMIELIGKRHRSNLYQK
jgi:hypothetical protein